MNRTDKLLGLLGAIGTLGAIVSGFTGQYVASLVMLTSVVVGWLLWLTVEVVSLRDPRKKEPQTDVTSAVFSELDEPLSISADRQNRKKIDGGFLLWPECTLSLWVSVPPKGEGLRSSPSNRYLLSHHTGGGDKKDTYRNQFALRHASSRDRWEVQTSNSEAEYGRQLIVKDGLNPGWHHFVVAWDRSAERQSFFVDRGTAGNDIVRGDFKRWPQQVDDTVVVGGWVSGWHGHYCQTEIAHLSVFDRYLAAGSPEIRAEISRKPSPA